MYMYKVALVVGLARFVETAANWLWEPWHECSRYARGRREGRGKSLDRIKVWKIRRCGLRDLKVYDGMHVGLYMCTCVYMYLYIIKLATCSIVCQWPVVSIFLY